MTAQWNLGPPSPGTAVLNGPWWAAAAILVLAAAPVRGQWQSRTQLKALPKNLASATD